MSGWRSPMASASSPLAETPNTAVRSAGSATPKRVRAHRRTSSTKNVSCAANRSGSNPGEYSWRRSVSSASRCAPTIIVDGTAAVSRTPPHCDISWPSPANTIASGGSGGTYTVTCRPPSYLNRSVTSSPAMDIVAVSLSVAQPAAFAGGAAGGFIVADPVAAGESAEAAFEAGAEPAGDLGGTGCCQRPRGPEIRQRFCVALPGLLGDRSASLSHTL